MRIITNRIPLVFTHLPRTYEILNKHGDEIIDLITGELHLLDGMPASSNATFKQIARDIALFKGIKIEFLYYYSKNPFIGHNVISHAKSKKWLGYPEYFINYNTRFHSAKTYKPIDWISNWAHETTHLADQISLFSYNHKNQNDYNSAPMVIARIARKVFMENIDRWVK